MVSLREALRIDSDIEVRNGDLITPGIAGSLDPDLTILIIAAVEGTRYASPGRSARVTRRGCAVHDQPYRRRRRFKTQFGCPLGVLCRFGHRRAVAKLADLIIDFIGAAAGLPGGSAELWVTSLPGEADMLVNGVPVGRTSEIDVLSFQEGRYLVEVRKEGFLPSLGWSNSGKWRRCC